MDGRRPRPGPYSNDFDRRLNELKQNLRPFRNEHTTEYISKITKSSRLSKQDSIEQILSPESSYQDIQRYLRNVADTMISKGVLVKHTSPKLDLLTDDLAKMLDHAEISTSMMADNKWNEMNHTSINSSGTINFNTMSRGNISGPSISVSGVNHVNIDRSSNESNTVSSDKTESSEILTKKLKNMQL